MNYIFIFILSILATAKMSFQSAFSKKSIVNLTDAVCFNIFVFIISALFFLPKVFDCSSAVWLYASLSAVATVAFQLSYTKALSIGNVSMTVFTVNCSMVINALVSFLFFGEPVSFVRLIAIGMTVVAFFVCNDVGKTDVIKKEWLFITIIAMLTNSAGALAQKLFGASAYSGENQAFISCLYIVSALIGIIIYLIIRKKETKNFKIGFNMIKYAFGVGASLAIYQVIYTYCLAHIDGTFLFPAQTGGIIIFSTLSGVLIFKDRFTKKQLFGVVLGLISLVMMNF